jgi:hypothetical protein
MATDDSINALIKTLRAIRGVTNARYWQTLNGSKRRIYIDTDKLNGGRSWNGGIGYWGCYLDLNSGKVFHGECAGAMTRNYHGEQNTFGNIDAAYQNYSESLTNSSSEVESA